jgi:DNA-binding response OmpR family regulator
MSGCDHRYRILVVDDDLSSCQLAERYLTGQGHVVVTAHQGAVMRRKLAEERFDLALLDPGFSAGEDGLAVLRYLHTGFGFPIIALSTNATTADRIACLELGADDFIGKPYEPCELLARMRALMRRLARYVAAPPPAGREPPVGMSFFGWRLDSDGHSLWSPDNEQIRLTGREFQILHALVERRGRILSRDQILDIIADRHWTPYDRSIDVMIAKIRRKLHDDARDTRFIKTIRGIGYMFASQTTQPQSRGY